MSNFCRTNTTNREINRNTPWGNVSLTNLNVKRIDDILQLGNETTIDNSVRL